MRADHLTHTFVEFMPATIEEGVLYISIPYTTAIHRCCCGCGEKLATPISPYDWSLTFDGVSTSLHPSVGSRTLACGSHYWIRNDRVEWLPSFPSPGEPIPGNADVSTPLSFWERARQAVGAGLERLKRLLSRQQEGPR